MKVISYRGNQRKQNGMVQPSIATLNDYQPRRAARSLSRIKAKAATDVEIETPNKVTENVIEREKRERRHEALRNMLLSKHQEIMSELLDNVGQALTEGQERRLESIGDAADQALRTFERDRSVFVMEMRNRKRQAFDEALTRLREGTYGICAECGIDINEKRLQAVPFAKLCVACQSRTEMLERIEQAEEREDS